jgi:hypothetical protein
MLTLLTPVFSKINPTKTIYRLSIWISKKEAVMIQPPFIFTHFSINLTKTNKLHRVNKSGLKIKDMFKVTLPLINYKQLTVQMALILFNLFVDFRNHLVWFWSRLVKACGL